MPNITPVYSRVGDIQSGVSISGAMAAAHYNGTDANCAVIFVADNVNGGYVQRIRLKAMGSTAATVARFWINNGSGRFPSTATASLGTPTGVAGSSAGVANGTYFVKIQAIDPFGQPSALSNESSGVTVTTSAAGTNNITWAWTGIGNTVSYKIWVGLGAGAEEGYFTSTTNNFSMSSYTVGPGATSNTWNNAFNPAVTQLSLYNNMFYGEVSLPTIAYSATSSSAEVDYPMNLALPPGYRLIAGLQTAPGGANSWNFTAIGGKY